MKKTLWFLGFFLSANCFAHTDYFIRPKGTFTYVSVDHGPYRISQFDLKSCDIYTKTDKSLILNGTIEKLNEWTRTYTFKTEDEVLSVHRSSFLSYGSFFDSLKEFEIRDNSDALIGYIEGKYNSDYLAEFCFFNDQHELFATARVQESDPELTIHSLDGQILISGNKTLKNLLGYSSYIAPEYDYFWTIKKEDNISFDPQFLWPFIGFVVEVWWNSNPYKILKKPL